MGVASPRGTDVALFAFRAGGAIRSPLLDRDQKVVVQLSTVDDLDLDRPAGPLDALAQDLAPARALAVAAVDGHQLQISAMGQRPQGHLFDLAADGEEMARRIERDDIALPDLLAVDRSNPGQQ